MPRRAQTAAGRASIWTSHLWVDAGALAATGPSYVGDLNMGGITRVLGNGTCPELMGDGQVEFEEYVAARGRALERYAYVLTGDAHRAQDLTQTALLKAYRRWRWVVRADHPDMYVRRIVTTSYLDWRRRRSNAEEPVARLPDVPAAGEDPAERVVARDQLRRALGGLTPGQRAVLVLRHLEGYDDDAIARVLQCSTGTVRSHASRGAHRLRELMEGDAMTTEGTARDG
jgi:RNA polymerase sigma-70 factor (sigma-E family)